MTKTIMKNQNPIKRKGVQYNKQQVTIDFTVQLSSVRVQQSRHIHVLYLSENPNYG